MSKFDLDTLKMGYIIRYKNDGSMFGNAIQNKQIAEGFSLDDSQYIHVEVSGGGPDSVNISFPKAKDIDIRKAHKGREIQILKYDNPDFLIYNKRYKIAYFNARLCNKGYDVGGIFSFIFKWIKQSNRNYFCSEGCAWSFQKVFPDIFGDKTADKIYPASFNTKYKFVEVCKCRIPE